MESQQEFWNERSEYYDDLNWVHDDVLMGWIYLQAEAVLTDIVARLTPEVLVIYEPGCGTGALTKVLLEAARAATEGTRVGYLVHAVDSSDAMVLACVRGLSDEIQEGHLIVGTRVDGEPGVPVEERIHFIAARMVLHHMPDPVGTVARWTKMLQPGGAIMVAEGVPPSADPNHPAARFFEDVFRQKEPDRTVLHGWMVGEWMVQAGCEQVVTHETFTEDNSMDNWLENSGTDDHVKGVVRGLHESVVEARFDPSATVVREVYRMRRDMDGDIFMRWRHAVVTGWVPEPDDTGTTGDDDTQESP